MTLVIVYLTFVFYLVSCPLCYLSFNGVRWYFINKILKDNWLENRTVKIMFLGDSRLNAAIDFRQIPGSWSFATGGTTPLENYFFLKKFLKKYPAPDTVVISISPRFTVQKFAFWHHSVKSGFFTFKDFYQIYKVHKKFPQDTIWDKNSLAKFLLYKIKFPSFYQNEVYLAKIFGRLKSNRILIRQMFELNGGHPHPGLKDSCSLPNFETRYKNYHFSKIFDYYFDKILKTCSDSGIYVIFLNMPMNFTSQKKLNPVFLRQYKEYLQSYQKKYSHFIISDTIYFYPDVYFGDPSHLNAKGKEKFTRFFIETYLK